MVRPGVPQSWHHYIGRTRGLGCTPALATLCPDAVTLGPSATVDAIVDRVESGDGCSVKDSFATLDLTSAGFRVLFEAEWIHRLSALPTVDGPLWIPARPSDVREIWGEALLPSLLAKPEVTMFVARAADEIVAGVVATAATRLWGCPT